MNWERPLANALGTPREALVSRAVHARDLCRQKKYGKALEVLWEILQSARKRQSDKQEAFVLIHMGYVYRHWIREIALKLFKDGLKAARSCGYKSAEMAACNGIGELYYAEGQPETALEYYKQSLQVSVAL